MTDESEDEPTAKGADKFFRHPAVLAVIGFLLTTVFAQIFQFTLESYRNADQRMAAQRALISQEADDAVALLDELVLLAHERATELSLLTFSLLDGHGDLTETRLARYYALYRAWVTTYQPQSRKILAAMGVEGGSGTGVQSDPFYRAIESKIAAESFLLAHACLRRVMRVSRENDHAPYSSWWGLHLPKFKCPRSLDSPLSTAPISFMQGRYRAARACATEIFFYAQRRIRHYETQRLLQVVDPAHQVTLLDPAENYPEACEL